jgi:hypothetical protein
MTTTVTNLTNIAMTVQSEVPVTRHDTPPDIRDGCAVSHIQYVPTSKVTLPANSTVTLTGTDEATYLAWHARNPIHPNIIHH